MKEAHNLKITPQIDSAPQKYIKKEVLQKILGQPDQKLAVYNGLHPVADTFSYLGVEIVHF